MRTWRGPRSRRRDINKHLKRFAGLTAGLLALAVVGPLTSATAEIAPTVYRTDGVSGQWTGPTTNTVSSPIWDMQVIGNTVYVAGKFLNVVEARGSWPEIPQPFLAAFDATSGEWIDWWRPELDAPVWALDQTADGRLLAAGEFDTVNGQPRGNLVALDARTGEIDPQFNAGVERPWTTAQSVIRDLYRDGDDLYLIGNFSHVNGGPNGLRTQVGKAARVDANNGTPDTVWKPQIQGRSGWGITTSSDGARVHLGGEFSSVNGQPDSKLLATVNATDGASVPGWDGGPNWSEHPVWPEGGIVYDIGVVGNNLFVAGAEHFWEMRSSTTGASLKLAPSTNDTQSVDVIDGRVYIGCHCDGRGNYSPGKQMRVIDGNTGTELTDITGNLRSGDGGWGTAKAPDGCLWLGGEFWGTTSLKDHPAGLRWVGNFARMCDAAGPLPHNVPSLVRPGDPLPEDLLIQPGDGWRYLSNDTHPAGWTTRAFDDSGWAAGASELGFGDGDEATVVPNAVGGQPITSALFRRSFDVPDPAEVDYLTVDLNVDDGATVWINGVPVVAENMPNGEIGAQTLASQAVWGAAESDFTRYEVPSNMLTAGTNTIAVSVHQNWRTSADLTFDAGLSIGRGTPANPTPTPNIAVAPPVVQGTALVAADANWAYLDDGSDQGTAWVAPGFADGAWSVGPAQLGYGDGDEATVIDEGRTGNGSRAITSYFRHGFDVANPAAFNELALGLLRDDGAIVYLNGTELLRDNMPAGNVAYNTPAADYAWGAGETDYQRYTAPSSLLVPGRNVLAVEVHSANPGSNDISFALTLDGV